MDGDGIGQFSVGEMKASIDKASFYVGRAFLPLHLGIYAFNAWPQRNYMLIRLRLRSPCSMTRALENNDKWRRRHLPRRPITTAARCSEAAQTLVESCGTYPGTVGMITSVLDLGDNATAITSKEKLTSLDSKQLIQRHFGSVTYTVTTGEGALSQERVDAIPTVKVDARFLDDDEKASGPPMAPTLGVLSPSSTSATVVEILWQPVRA